MIKNIIITVLSILLLVSYIFGYIKGAEAEKNMEEALRQQELATAAAAHSRQAQAEVHAQIEIAEAATLDAHQNLAEAERQRQLAEKAKKALERCQGK